MNTLEDALPNLETDEERLAELKKLIEYLSNCDLANKSFVPAGFTFLSAEARTAIDTKVEQMKLNETKELPSALDRVDPRMMFVENYPFWVPPFEQTNQNFRFGDRVANIDTHKRKFVPFGEIGTVVGHTLDGVIVRFDNPNVVLTDVHDTCLPYTGAVVHAKGLINLTLNSEMKHQQKKQQNFRQHGNPNKNSYNPSQNQKKGGGSKSNYDNSTKGFGKFNPKKGGGKKSHF